MKSRVLAFLFLSWFAFMLITRRFTYTILDSANFMIHEVGHIVFLPFGEFIHFIGGSLFQVLIPFALAAYFFAKRSLFSALVMIFWAGQSIINVSYYVADAQVKVLNIIGGDHDWEYILGMTGQLHNATEIGLIFFSIGSFVIVLSMIGMGTYIYYEYKNTL